MSEPRPIRRGRSLGARAWLVVALGLLSVFAFVGQSHAALTIEAIGSSSWSNSTQTITTSESLPFKNTSGLAHGVKWGESVPAPPSCSAGVPTGNNTNASNWEGTCTFSQPGGYPFICSLHTNMAGSITVNSAGPGAPIVTTSAATGLTDTGATLNGSVNPNGLETKYFFNYGTTDAYGQKTEEKIVGSGTSPVSKSETLSGLTPATTYHFQLVAKNSSGETKGTDQTFTTPGPPLATTSAAILITSTKATLRGSVNPRGHATTYYFKYGETTSYGKETAVTSAGFGTSPVVVSAPVTGLSPGTTYHFLLVANNSSGEATGSDLSFTTSPPDTDDPETTITGKPGDPTNRSTVEFTYVSDEPDSTFECKMDGEAFSPCPPTGKTYNGLGEGQHNFQVRAIDSSLNSDDSPATYSFSVVLAAAPPEVIPPTIDPPPVVDPPSAPETTMTLKPKAKTKDRTPTFKFRSSAAGATFECKLDGKPLRPCRSPLTTKPLSFARHTLTVAAVAGGVKDSSPAAASFKVLRPKR